MLLGHKQLKCQAYFPGLLFLDLILPCIFSSPCLQINAFHIVPGLNYSVHHYQKLPTYFLNLTMSNLLHNYPLPFVLFEGSFENSEATLNAIFTFLNSLKRYL